MTYKQIWHIDQGPWDGHIHVNECDSDEPPARIIMQDGDTGMPDAWYELYSRDSFERPEFTYRWMPVPPLLINTKQT